MVGKTGTLEWVRDRKKGNATAGNYANALILWGGATHPHGAYFPLSLHWKYSLEHTYKFASTNPQGASSHTDNQG